MSTGTKTWIPRWVLPLAVVVAIIGGLMYTVNGTRCADCKIVRAEVESTTNFQVTLNSMSTVHGQRTHADATYSKSFAEDIEVAPGESIEIYVTAAVTELDSEKSHGLACRIRVNGKMVRNNTLMVRAGTMGKPVDCAVVVAG